jgi:hypothetical protein
MALLATVLGASNLFAKGGIVLEKPYPWSPATEVISVREFSRQAMPGNFETGYKEYFVEPNGKKFAIDRVKIAKVIFYPNLEDNTDIQEEAQLSPILGDISELKTLAAKYELAKPYLDRQIAKLQSEISLFRQGARKIGGTWHSAEEIARKRQEAADREAKLQAARKVEEEKQAASRADAERAAMERKAAAEAALREVIADFKNDTADLLQKASLPASDFQELRTLEDVKELPAATAKSIALLADRVRGFREKKGYDSVIEACRAEISTVNAWETRSKVAQEIHAGNAAAAVVDLASFYQDNPSPASEAQKDLWRSLASIRSICERLDKESETHLERAKSLSSTGKPGDAIREFQEAYRIFPDPKVASIIKKLREDSLGL